MKKLAFALVGTGLFLIVVSLWADSLGIGGDRGLGASQLLGIQVGALLALIGVGLITVESGDVTVRERARLSSVIDAPVLFWVLVTFLVAYVSFFLLPVFFSRLQIHYLTRYIPDAFITHIGFDIEAIVSRIENWLRTGQSPYTDGFLAYPPLTMVIFSTLSLIGYPAYFRLMAGVTGLAYLVAALLVPWSLLPKRNRVLLILFFITGLFSYGLQFEQERGQFNLIAFTFCLVAIYVFHFHPRFRFFAYLLFCLSIQLKVYPIFFVPMFIDDWRNWRSILRRFVGLGVVNFFLLLIAGRTLFFDFMRVITDYQLLESSRYENLSIKGFASYLANDIFGQANPAVSTGWLEAAFWLLLAACFVAVLGSAILHKTPGLNPYLLVTCTIAALIIPSVSNDYKLSILIVPVALLLCCLPELSHPGKKRIMSLLVILLSLAYWTTLYPATVKPDFLDRNFPALMLILVCTVILNFLSAHSDERKIQETLNPADAEQ